MTGTPTCHFFTGFISSVHMSAKINHHFLFATIDSEKESEDAICDLQISN